MSFSDILGAMNFGYGVFRDNQSRSDARSAEDRAWKRQRKADATKVQTLVKDARAAGMHPLAAMGVQVGQGYGTSGSVYSGNAGGDALSSWSASPRSDPLVEENKRLQNAAIKADIERTRADTARILAASATSRSDIARLGAVTRGAADKPVPVKLFGGTLLRNPERFSSADVASQEYGEIAEHIVGLPAMFDAAWRGITAMPKSIPSGRLPGSQWSR